MKPFNSPSLSIPPLRINCPFKERGKVQTTLRGGERIRPFFLSSWTPVFLRSSFPPEISSPLVPSFAKRKKRRGEINLARPIKIWRFDEIRDRGTKRNSRGEPGQNPFWDALFIQSRPSEFFPLERGIRKNRPSKDSRDFSLFLPLETRIYPDFERIGEHIPAGGVVRRARNGTRRGIPSPLKSITGFSAHRTGREPN